jgi:hypothetical protein
VTRWCAVCRERGRKRRAMHVTHGPLCFTHHVAALRGRLSTQARWALYFPSTVRRDRRNELALQTLALYETQKKQAKER